MKVEKKVKRKKGIIGLYVQRGGNHSTKNQYGDSPEKEDLGSRPDLDPDPLDGVLLTASWRIPTPPEK